MEQIELIDSSITIEIVDPCDEASTAPLRGILRDDISEDFADSMDTIIANARYGAERGLCGHLYAIGYRRQCIGMVLLGDALEWPTDPPEMQLTPFYRLMGFIIDKRFRGHGIGAYALERVIAQCYGEFGVRPIALGVHKRNHRAADFYRRHGFVATEAMEGNDRYFLRFPADDRI